MASEQNPSVDLPTFLQRLSVWQTLAEENDNNKSELRNLVAHNTRMDDIIIFNPKANTLVVVALNSFSQTRTEQTQEITLDSIPPTGIKQILYHKNGKLVCLVGSSRCAIIDISEKRSKFYTGSPILCRLQHVGALLHTAKPSVRVLHVEWHPLSESHFGVLTSDNALRLYEAFNVEDCEQTFHLFSLTSGSHSATESSRYNTNDSTHTPSYVPNTPYSPSPYTQSTPSRSPYPPHDSRSPYSTNTPSRASASSIHVPEAVSFCFGNGAGWTAFSVYFLSQKGQVYCICPILPNFVHLPKSLFVSLNQSILAKLQVLKEVGTDEVLPHFGYYNAQLKWLSEIQGESDISDEIANISLYGQLDGIIETRPPTNKLNLVLQGPMDKDYPGDPPESRTNPCNLVYVACEKNSSNASSLSPAFGIFVKLFAGGIVEIMLNLEDTNPLWTLKNQPDFETYVPQLLLYEQAKLDLTNESSSVNRPTPYIFPSTNYPYHFMIMDVTGLYSLQLVWLEKFKEFVETTDEITEFPQFPQSQFVRIVSTAFMIENRRAPPPVGVALVHQRLSAGYFALVLLSVNKCTCIDINVEKSTQLPTKVLHGVTKPLRKEPVPFQYLASPQAPLNSLEVWALLTGAITHLRKEYVGYILGCEADANENFAAVSSEIESQSKRLQYEKQRIAEQIQQSSRIEKRIAGCLKVQEHAAKRIKNIIAIANSSKSLSNAERDYFKELYEYYYIVHTKLRAKIEELSFQTEKELRKLQTGGKAPVVQLAEDQLTQISTALQEEYQTIAKNVQTVKDLESAMAQKHEGL